MKKNVKIFSAAIAAIMLAVICFAYPINGTICKVYAAEDEETITNEPDRGLFVTVSISINGGNGQVWTTAQHEFSLFSTTVEIYVFLYYSTTFTTDYQDMTLACYSYASNLGRGDTLTATASTGGEQRYWIGRMYYSIDNREWESRIVGPKLYSSTGVYIEM